MKSRQLQEPPAMAPFTARCKKLEQPLSVNALVVYSWTPPSFQRGLETITFVRRAILLRKGIVANASKHQKREWETAYRRHRYRLNLPIIEVSVAADILKPGNKRGMYALYEPH